MRKLLKEETPGPHFDAGVDGADEEDVGEHDEDGDVQAEHERRAAAQWGERIRAQRSSSKAPRDLIEEHISWLKIQVKLGKATHFGKMMTWTRQMQQKTKRLQAT